MFKKLKKKLNSKSELIEQKAYDVKSKFMEDVLGKEYDQVLHAIIPYAAGGGLDLYYYPHFENGTAIATKELVDSKFDGPKNKCFDSYELVMCSKQPINVDSVKDENPQTDSFAYDHQSINRVLNAIARYSSQAELNPYETLEFPADFANIGGKCFILDILSGQFQTPETNNKKFGLMLIMEIHRSEMEYAMQQKGKELIELLMKKKVYPFTGINRAAVI